MTVDRFPEEMWFTSTEHPSWAAVRAVHPVRMLRSVAGAEYLLLRVDQLPAPLPDNWANPPCLLVGTRSPGGLVAPRPGRQDLLDTWAMPLAALTDPDIALPPRPLPDAWCNLCSTREDAAAIAARPFS